MPRIHVNNFVTSIDGAIDNSVTSIDLTSVSGFPVIGSGVTANLTLQLGATYEIVTATARSGNTLTVIRGQEGTAATSWADGSSISIRPTADSFDRKEDLISGRTFDDVGTPASGDLILLQDASDSTKLKVAAFSTFGGGGGGGITDLTGDVTASGSGSVAATIANGAVTYAKIQNVSANNKILGRVSSGAGNIEEIDCTAAGRALLDDADASAQRTTLGLGTLATQNGTFSGTSSGTNTGDQNIFQTIAVSGQSDVVADSTTDTLTLVAGSNITITTNASTDTITIASSGGGGGGMTMNIVSGTTQTAAVNNGYICTNSSQCNVTLPTTAAVGSLVKVVSQGAGGIRITAGSGQTIKGLGDTTTTAGTLTPSAQYDSIQVICVVADTTWVVDTFTSSLLTFA